ncbi:MAG: MarR family winged helix-turn-helix transcriptional regulator [Patescibacteria group bacterium]|nr:MarR family winged helix-turn-helix transcriptional regulator [Patescibacteria group bacterium]
MKDINKIIELVFILSRITREGVEEKNNLLSYIQFQTLSFLIKQKNPTMKEISKHVHITSPSATILINNLVRMGLVSRVNDKDDRRVIRLIITTKGREELEKGFLMAKKHLKKVFRQLSEKDRDDFVRILTKLSKLFNHNT